MKKNLPENTKISLPAIEAELENFTKYFIYDLKDTCSSGAVEHLGSKRKGWLTYKLQGQTARILFKQGRVGSGENWAEKVTCELAQLLNLPHAIYELAYLSLSEDKFCVISPNFLKKNEELKLGNELIEGFDKDQRFKNTKHTLSAILDALQHNKVLLPYWHTTTEQEHIITEASHLLIGYLCFDAWIGNTDRHAENWGIINKIEILDEGTHFLAPTFDHASSLGRNEPDARRKERLETKNKDRSIQKYVQNAMTPIYSQYGNQLNTISVIQECRQFNSKVTDYWIEKIIKITQEEQKIKKILTFMPTDFMSNIAKDFAIAFLKESTKQLRKLQDD